MTYKEAYMNCKAFKELEEMVAKDALIAMMWNPDRIRVIENVVNEVCIEKGWDKND